MAPGTGLPTKREPWAHALSGKKLGLSLETSPNKRSADEAPRNRDVSPTDSAAQAFRLRHPQRLFQEPASRLRRPQLLIPPAHLDLENYQQIIPPAHLSHGTGDSLHTKREPWAPALAGKKPKENQ